MHPSRDRITAYEAFVREHGGAVSRFLRRRAEADTAEDVFAEVMLVVWRRFEDVPSEPLPWLYVIARNCLRDAERSARRRTRLVNRIVAVDPPTVAYDPGADDPATSEVSKAISQLRPADAEVLRLWAWEELTPQEMATVLSTSVNAATIRLHRAKKKLREQLEKNGWIVARGTSEEGAA